MKKLSIVFLYVSLLSLSAVYARFKSENHDANAIFRKVVRGFQEIQDFTAAIDAEVKMDRVQIPKMNATIYFKKPDKIHFSSQSFLLVPRDGIALNPAVLEERYDASFVREDTLDGRKLLKLQLAAKGQKTRLRQLYIWIDPLNWTIVRTETIPYEGRTLSMVFTYEHQQDKFWLPSKLVVSFGSTTEGEKVAGDSTSQPAEQFDQMHRGMPRNGSVTILYSNYKVNVGLEDIIFEEKK